MGQKAPNTVESCLQELDTLISGLNDGRKVDRRKAVIRLLSIRDRIHEATQSADSAQGPTESARLFRMLQRALTQIGHQTVQINNRVQKLENLERQVLSLASATSDAAKQIHQVAGELRQRGDKRPESELPALRFAVEEIGRRVDEGPRQLATTLMAFERRLAAMEKRLGQSGGTRSEDSLAEGDMQTLRELGANTKKTEEALAALAKRSQAIEDLSLVLHPLSLSVQEATAAAARDADIGERLSALSEQIQGLTRELERARSDMEESRDLPAL